MPKSHLIPAAYQSLLRRAGEYAWPENYRCLDCHYVGPLNQRGQCDACLSSGVISDEVVKIKDLDYEVIFRA